MRKIFKVGVIGVGFIGPVHIEAIRRRGLEVLAIAENGQTDADKAAERLKIPKAYGDWRDLVTDPEIDVVHVTSPNYLHYEHAKGALEAGKHVICEKPLAMTTEESGDLVRMAEKKNLVNAVNFNLRFYPLIQDAKARISAGELGSSIYIIQGSYLQDWLLYETDWNWRLEPDLGGELRAIADIGSHWMDLVTFITGKKIISVFADFETFLPVRKMPMKKMDTFGSKMDTDTFYEEKRINTEDYAAVLFKFEGGTRGVMTVSQVSSGRKNRLYFEINGSESSLMWDSEKPNQMMIGHRSEPNQIIIKDPSLMKESARWAASYPGGHPEGFPDTFKQLQTAVYDQIASGHFDRAPNYPTFKDGHYNILIDEAILKSAKEGKWVDINY